MSFRTAVPGFYAILAVVTVAPTGRLVGILPWTKVAVSKPMEEPSAWLVDRMNPQIGEEMSVVEIQIEMTMRGRIQKPIRTERLGRRPHDEDGVARRRCLLCGHKTTFVCPDCAKHLCCQRYCDRRHARRCRPVKRDVMHYP